MKLRIRSLETLETQRIEVPSACSLRRLKELISVAFSSSSSLPVADSIHLSLNRKDEIQSPPDENIFQSLGIISGDLVFFTLDPNGFSPQTLVSNSQPAQESTSIISQNPKSSDPQINSGSVMLETAGCIPNSNVNLLAEACDKPESSNMDGQNEEFVEEEMEVDDINDEGYAMEAVGSSFSAPSFLKKVFTAELGGRDGGENHKLLLVSIHAVLLESGFTGFDMDLKNEIKGFQFRNNWPKNMFMMSLFYTLPGIIGQVFPSSEYQNGVLVLKFQSTGNVVNVYGSLYSASTHTYLLRLNEDYLVPFLNVAWANCGLGEKIASKDGSSFTSPGTEVFNFWKNVKDELALPLLMDLCDRAGLVLPPCFMRLPTDLKLKILESLPGDDIAKVSCVCCELRYLALNDDLWRVKFVQEFDDAGSLDARGDWKRKFVRRWQSRKKRLASRTGFGHPRRMMMNNQRIRFPQIRIIGDDYDLLPRPPTLPSFYQVGLPSNRHRSQTHITRCNWDRDV